MQFSAGKRFSPAELAGQSDVAEYFGRQTRRGVLDITAFMA